MRCDSGKKYWRAMRYAPLPKATRASQLDHRSFHFDNTPSVHTSRNTAHDDIITHRDRFTHTPTLSRYLCTQLTVRELHPHTPTSLVLNQPSWRSRFREHDSLATPVVRIIKQYRVLRTVLFVATTQRWPKLGPSSESPLPLQIAAVASLIVSATNCAEPPMRFCTARSPRVRRS